ncbi:Uncharacterized protein GY17_00001008 [Cryptosporidium hominis]|uniref:Uncharacterized protein n=1 Tax=Cryptosporidium hominis TaxID=237895 RepID=A0ABX5BF12_CRYHO|nr:Uncharacterized protein GY17_00001008 [Cryptosporidium hominis]|eukprot:PPS96939.1 Uncharacterized protein GY17_00001008 [Cryptosporidium hominis]
MKSQVLYLTVACFVFFFYSKETSAAELPNSSNKPQVVTKLDLQNVEITLLKETYSIFCQLMCLIKLLNLFNSLNNLSMARQSQELLLILSKEKNVTEKQSEIREELLKRNIDLLSSIDVDAIKKCSDLTRKLSRNICSNSSRFAEFLLELIELIQSIIYLITGYNLETSISEDFSSENVRDLLLSLNDYFLGLVLDATQQNENQEQGVNKESNSMDDLLLSLPNQDLYNDESHALSSQLGQEQDLYLECSENSNINKERKAPTSDNKLGNNDHVENGASKKSKRKKNRKDKDGNVNSKENICQTPPCNIQANRQDEDGRFEGASPSNTSGVKTRANITKLEASNADEGSARGKDSTHKKRTSKKKHLQSSPHGPQPQVTFVQPAELIALDPRGGAKQKVKTKTDTSKNDNRRNSRRRSRSPSPKPCTSSGAQTGSSSRSSSPRPCTSSGVQTGSSFRSHSPRPRVSSRSQAGSSLRSHLQSKGKSRSRRSRSRSRDASPTAPRTGSVTEGDQSKDGELEASEALFLIQEAEETLTEILKLEDELLNLSFKLHEKLGEMDQLLFKIIGRGDKFAAIIAQMEIIKVALEDWRKKIDFSSNGKYVLMNAKDVLAAIPPSVAARQGLASRVCGSRDCCKVGHPSDKYIVGANQCGCRMCDCSCLFCLPHPFDSPKKSIYDVD